MIGHYTTGLRWEKRAYPIRVLLFVGTLRHLGISLFDVPMTAPTEGYDVLKSVSILWVVKLTYRPNMVDIELTALVRRSRPTTPAFVVISFTGFASNLPPLASIDCIPLHPHVVFLANDVLREPIPDAILATKSSIPFVQPRLQDVHRAATLLTRLFDPLGVFHICVTKKLISAGNTIRAVHTVLI